MNEQIVLSLDRVVALVLRGLLAAVLLATAAAGAVYTYYRRQPPSYASQTVLTVSTSGFDSGKYGLPSVSVPPLHVTAYRIATLSSEMLAGTLRDLGIADTPSAVQRLRDRTAISTDDRAQLVYVTVTDRTAAGAAKTANALAARVVAWDAERTAAALAELTQVLEQRGAAEAAEIAQLTTAGNAPARLAAVQTQAAETAEALAGTKRLMSNAPGSVTVLQGAVAPLTTVAPTPLFNAVLAALLALALVYAFVLVQEIVDPRVYGADDALKTTRLPLLALLPPTTGRRAYPAELGATLFDGLVAAAGGPPAAVQVTSATGDEGALRVAAALAEAATYHGHRTLLVDADLTEPRLPGLYRDRAKRGTDLSAYLANAERRYQANPVDIGHSQPLYVLFESSPRPAPGTLGRTFARQLESWRDEFDLVVVRTAPWSSTQDAALVAPLVSGTAIVTNARRVRRRLLLGQLAAVRRTGGLVYGLVVTHARRDDPAALSRAAPVEIRPGEVATAATTSRPST